MLRGGICRDSQRGPIDHWKTDTKAVKNAYDVPSQLAWLDLLNSEDIAGSTTRKSALKDDARLDIDKLVGTRVTEYTSPISFQHFSWQIYALFMDWGS